MIKCRHTPPNIFNELFMGSFRDPWYYIYIGA